MMGEPQSVVEACAKRQSWENNAKHFSGSICLNFSMNVFQPRSHPVNIPALAVVRGALQTLIN